MNFLNKLNLPMGRWFNVPVFLHWSWLLLFVFIVVSWGWTMAIVYAGAFFIVLLHEFGHCIAAQKYGVNAAMIMLYPFGGAAMLPMPPEPKKELVVALAGPLVNVLLMPLLYLLAPAHLILAQLFYINIVLLVFNLVPAFPMDGGRVLRALLSMGLGNHEKATVIAGRIGQAICVLFGLLGIMSGHFMLIAIGFFIFMAAEQEIQMVRSYKALRNLYQHFTGEEPPGADYDVHHSASMIEELQRRMSRLNNED